MCYILIMKWKYTKAIFARLVTTMELSGMNNLTKFLDALVPVIKIKSRILLSLRYISAQILE